MHLLQKHNSRSCRLKTRGRAECGCSARGHAVGCHVHRLQGGVSGDLLVEVEIAYQDGNCCKGRAVQGFDLVPVYRSRERLRHAQRWVRAGKPHEGRWGRWTHGKGKGWGVYGQGVVYRIGLT